MNNINDKIFGSVQKEKLRQIGCSDDTDIEVLIIGRYGEKMVRVNGVVYLI